MTRPQPCAGSSLTKIVALDVHLETFHALREPGQAVPVGQVKFVGMHGSAGGDAAAKCARPQGPVLVRTGVADGVIASVHVERPPGAHSH